MTLGLDCHGDIMSPLIKRGMRLPFFAKMKYGTLKDNQKKVKIVVRQGEHHIASKNQKMGEYVFRGIPPAPKGQQKITVNFNVNEAGILTVSCGDLTVGDSREIKIRVRSINLTADERMSLQLISEYQARKSIRMSSRISSGITNLGGKVRVRQNSSS